MMLGVTLQRSAVVDDLARRAEDINGTHAVENAKASRLGEVCEWA